MWLQTSKAIEWKHRLSLSPQGVEACDSRSQVLLRSGERNSKAMGWRVHLAASVQRQLECSVYTAQPLPEEEEQGAPVVTQASRWRDNILRGCCPLVGYPWLRMWPSFYSNMLQGRVLNGAQLWSPYWLWRDMKIEHGQHLQVTFRDKRLIKCHPIHTQIKPIDYQLNSPPKLFCGGRGEDRWARV